MTKDEEEEEKAKKKRKQMESFTAAANNSSVKSFLSPMPAPKSSQTLGALLSLGSGSGTGRRSILETATPAITQSTDQTQLFSNRQVAGVVDNNYAGYGGYEHNPSGNGDAFGYGGYEQNASGRGDVSGYVGYDVGGSSYGGGGNAWNGGGGVLQPESSSSKRKVSKLHKRKHQITALFMDMKHKESELSERRSKGLLIKAETHAKYGW